MRLATHKRAPLPVLFAGDVGRPRRGRVLRNPIVAGQLEYLVQSVYDIFTIAVNTLSRRETLFSIPIGQAFTGAGAGAAIVKTLFHTNLVQAGQLDAPKKQLVKAISLVVRNDIHPTDLNLLVGTAFVQFVVSGKEYSVQLAQKYPAGGGAFSSTTLNAVNSAVNGWPSTGNCWTITDDLPQVPGQEPMEPINGVLIEQQQNFSLIYDPTQTGAAAFTTLAAGAGGTGVVAHGFLEGVQMRAVL